MPVHALNSQRNTWNKALFPSEIANWDPTSNAREAACSMRATVRNIRLNSYAAHALVAYAKKENADMALIDTGSGTYSAEKSLPDLTTIVATLNRPRRGVNAFNLRAACVTPTNAYTPVPPLRADSGTDLSPIFLCILPFLMEDNATVANDVNDVVTAFGATGSFDSCENTFRRVVDTMTYVLDERVFDIAIPGSNIDLLARQSVTMGSLNGNVMCGTPSILSASSAGSGTAGRPMTFAEAKREFQSFASQHEWTAEEQALIPVFPEDYRVPPEAIRIARFYVRTRSDRRPMNNFMWRGTTSYGKSSGVELIAGFLSIPLLRMTCNTTMETQDLLSSFVPDTTPYSSGVELPTFTEIAADPASAYRLLTGTEDEDATCEMCLRAYGEAVAARTGNGSARFKRVDSNFVKALTRGYIVELQEISRIKDSGVLVGLNELDRPGAIIPLVDGSFERRHPDAMVVYTDNVGYASCRPIDPSVLRRMSLIIDSYELPKADAIARVLYNTEFPDKVLLDQMYDVWAAVQAYCAEHDISEGSVSVTELEMWALAVKVEGMSNLKENCRLCVVSKATSDRSEQDAIMADVIDIRLT